MVMLLYITNLSEARKSKKSDVLRILAIIRCVLYLPCTAPATYPRGARMAAIGSSLPEVLVCGLLFLLLGLLLVVCVVDKKEGSLR